MIARVSWVLVSLVGVALFVASIPAYHDSLRALSGFGMYATAPPGAVRAALDELGLSVGFYATYQVASMVVLALTFWAVGALIFWRRSNDWWALYLSLVLVTLGSTVGMTYYPLGREHPVLILLGDVMSNFSFVSFFLLLYLFPNGKFTPRWTRWVAAFYVTYVMFDWLFPNSPYNLDNRGLLGAPVMVVVVGTMVYAQVYRYRHVSGPIERQQTKWVAFGFITVTVSYFGLGLAPFLFLSPDHPGVADVLYELVTRTVVGLAVLSVPLSIGIAILRYRLWEIDIIINRTLVYGALTVIVAGLYVLVVGALGALLQARSNLLVSLLAAGLVAILFAPLRERLQGVVNRMMYGERDDPYKVLSRLGERLEATLAPEAVSSAIVETVAQTLKLPYTAITLMQDGAFVKVAEYGERPTGKPYVTTLTYQKETVGELLVSPRAPGESFSRSDLRLLEDLARQVGIAAHAVRLTMDLQRARERLVAAREEERRRLRRDLHDGVGPRLAALMLRLDAARNRLSDDPETKDLLLDLAEGSREAVADIRRAVQGLRPPALDELGLIPALREGAAEYSHDGLKISVHGPDALPALPAAVEVACYHIAQEAMTNVVRHSGASKCSVNIALEEARTNVLRLEVIDDGKGMSEQRGSGVGLHSMRERAEELGGRCAVESLAEGGTRVIAELPRPASEGSSSA